MKSFNCIDFYLYLRYNNRMRNNNISQRLKTLRKNSGKSQAQIAELNGTVTQPAIFRYEHGLTDVPNDVLLWYAVDFRFSLCCKRRRKAINRTAKRHRKTKRSEHSVKSCNVFIV